MTARVKVLVLTASLNVGGAETYMLHLVQQLGREARGLGGEDFSVEVHLCAFGAKSVFGEKTLLPKVRELSIPIKIVRAKRFYSFKSWLEVRRYIQQEDIDLIHTFLSNADIVGNLLGKWLRIPVVTTLENIPADYDLLRSDLRWLMRNVAIRWASRIVALSEEIRLQAIEAWSVDDIRIVTINNAIPLDDFVSIQLGTAGERSSAKVTVTTIGRLTPQKAQNDFLHAAAIVLANNPDVDFQIVGEGELEFELKTLARELEIEENVKFLGMRRDIPSILAMSDIFLLSSKWEGMPVAAIEAMAAGRPQILTRVGANGDLVTEGEQGLLVPPGDPGALANAILQLAADASLREEMGAKARARAVQRYAIQASSEQYRKLYGDVVSVGKTI